MTLTDRLHAAARDIAAQARRAQADRDTERTVTAAMTSLAWHGHVAAALAVARPTGRYRRTR